MTEYYIPTGDGEAEFVEKRSSFLGHVRLVETEDEAKEFIAQMKKKYYDARHNCWCYIIKDGAERYSDDGEPQGTAGIPMLEVFRRENVCNVVCVVTRYFGGILLGAGGLLRAYTRSAKDALDAAGKLKLEVGAFDGIVADMEYGAEVIIRVYIPEEKGDEFAERIFDVSHGSVKANVTGEDFKAVPVK